MGSLLETIMAENNRLGSINYDPPIPTRPIALENNPDSLTMQSLNVPTYNSIDRFKTHSLAYEPPLPSFGGYD